MPMRTAIAPARMNGLTLVELMVAMTLGIVVVGALAAVFISSNRNYRQNEALAGIQDNARFALDALGRDLAMAGYWGGVRAVDAALFVRVSTDARTAISRSGTESDCGPAASSSVAIDAAAIAGVTVADYYWLFDVGVPLVFRDHTVTADVSTAFRCLATATLQANSDVVVIRRAAGQAVLANDGSGDVGDAPTANRFYLKTNQNVSSIFRADSSFSLAIPADCPDAEGASSSCEPGSAPFQVYAYTPQIYYVRNFLRTPGDGLPILCRRFLDDSGSTASMAEDCLAEGVESLQIEWGIGTGGEVSRYLSNPTPAELAQALSARIHLLVRATQANTQSSGDAKTFTLANYSVTPAAGVLRRAFTTTVQLKNLDP